MQPCDAFLVPTEEEIDSQRVFQLMASMIGEAGSRLSTTALWAAAEGGRDAIVDKVARSPMLATMRRMASAE
jgi:chloramphenicol 3-O-phosphotransferase